MISPKRNGMGYRKLQLLTGVGLCASLCTPVAIAQDEFGGSLGITSDYRVRGISLTIEEPAVQGGIHKRWQSGWFVGGWASTMNRNRGPSATLEIDTYAGIAWNLARDWDAKVAVTHYWYPDDPARTDYDYDEIAASISYRAQLVATVTWSPNTTYFGHYQGTWYAEQGSSSSYELTGLQPLFGSLALTAGVGYSDLTQIYETGYWYWNVGITCALGPVQLDLLHIDSDEVAEDLFGAARTEAGWSAAISWRF